MTLSEPQNSTLDSHAVDAARPGAVVEVVEAEVGRVLPQPHLVAAPVRVLVAHQVRLQVDNDRYITIPLV